MKLHQEFGIKVTENAEIDPKGDKNEVHVKTTETTPDLTNHSELKFRKNPIFTGQKTHFLYFQKYKNTFFNIFKSTKKKFFLLFQKWEKIYFCTIKTEKCNFWTEKKDRIF